LETKISIEDKISFIKWFLHHYQLKKRESIWILNYLVNHEELLSHVHFVAEARFCPRAMIMSTHCSKGAPFRFYKKHIVTTDADKSFHDIRLHAKEPIYIQLNFLGSNKSIPYMKVLEINPYLPDDYFLTREDKQLAEDWLTYTIYNHQKEKLLDQINIALDQKDKASFDSYSKKLNHLEASFENI